MQKFRLGKTEMMISAVTFGGIIVMDETDYDAKTHVDAAIDSGVNYFDVAPSYGNAQDQLGPALKKYRNDVYLACKSMERSAAGIKAELINSLKMLETDHFDVYQMHAMKSQNDIDLAFADDGAMKTLIWAKQEGIIRHIGFSTHNEDIALKALDLFDFETVLFPMYWAMGINAGWGDRISQRTKELDIGLLAMKTLIHRKWDNDEEAKAYPKSWCKPIYANDALGIAAMKYGLSKGAATLIPPGNFEHYTFMIDHIDECLAAPLSDAEWVLLRAEAAQVKDHAIF